ncbi:hypothetical protein PCANB_002804 [Pneumocystis canis]|nr:hypothetical protein PCANB_002804 [Pneumocystis canis]
MEKFKHVINTLELNTYKEATIIEMSPGPGIMTQALFKKINPKLHILMEPNRIFHPFLKKICEKAPNQFILTELDGFLWSSYSTLKAQGLLNPNYQPMDQIHSSLLFAAHLPHGALGEQLLAQFFTARFDEIWIHQYGRIRMLLWVTTPLARRIMAAPGKPGRCKLSVVSETVANCRIIIGNKDIPGLWSGLKTIPEDFIREKDLILMEAIPLSEIPIKTSLDSFDYVVRHLFVLRKTPLMRAISTLGPGAEILAKDLPLKLLDKKVDEMTRDDFDEIAQVFDKWPFKPKILFDQWVNDRETSNMTGGRFWGQYFQNISKKIIAKKPQFHCDLFNLRFYPRDDIETLSSDCKNIAKSVYRVSRRSNVYYLRGLVRVTVLTSKKRISNVAYIRSKVRRRLREAARHVLLFRDENNFPYLPVVPYDLFFVAKMSALHEDWKTLLYYVEEGLKKALQLLNKEQIPGGFVSMKISDLESLPIDKYQSKNKMNSNNVDKFLFKTKSITNFEKQKDSLQSNDFIRRQFIRSVIKITNSPFSTSINVFLKNIDFLLKYYKLRKITSFDMEMLTFLFKQSPVSNIHENYPEIDKIENE